MRIASLVPHATELLFALGLEQEVVAVTHECDYPQRALRLPKLTGNVLADGLSAAEIDAAVRQRTSEGKAIYTLDEQALARCAPDLIVTQALCPVCAVSYEQVADIATRMPSEPEVIALDPKTLGETLGDVRTLASATGRKDVGVDLVEATARRIDAVKLAVRGLRRPRVLALEWLDPPFVAGHWTPQLIELAGGEDVIGMPGEPSGQYTWEQLGALTPEIVIVMPCGYDIERAYVEAIAYSQQIASLGAGAVVAVDASAYFSRPGPRLVDGLELLASVLHGEALGGVPVKAEARRVPVKAEAKVVPVQAEAKVVPVQAEAKLVPVQAEAKVVPPKTQAKPVPVRTEAKVVPPKTQAKPVPVAAPATRIAPATEATAISTHAA